MKLLGLLAFVVSVCAFNVWMFGLPAAIIGSIPAFGITGFFWFVTWHDRHRNGGAAANSPPS